MTSKAKPSFPAPRIHPATPQLRAASETYSNGSHVVKKFATTNRPRAYYTYDRHKNLELSLTVRNQPANRGIPGVLQLKSSAKMDDSSA